VNITDVSIRNPVFAWMLMASTMLFGIVAVSRLGVSQYPDVDYPNISVSVSWPGASPSAVERELLEPLEQAISQVEGVTSMQSKASAGSARITVVFDMSRDVDLALQDVQARVGSATRSLPKDVAPASVSKSNPDDQPILTIGVSGPFSRQVLADVAAYQVQEKIQTVSGVGQITLTGYLARNIRIWLDSSRLAEKGVLNRHREGLAYVYSPAITEDDFVTMVVQQVLDGLLDDYSETAVDYMVDYLARRNPSELRRLQKALQARVAA